VTKKQITDSELPVEFYGKLTVSLVEHIVCVMGEVRVARFQRFADRLCNIALLARDFEDRMKLDMKAKKPLRASRVRCGRAKAAIEHSLDFLQKAEAIGKKMIDKDGLLPGWLNFEQSKRALEQIKKRIRVLESTSAALIHPRLRKRGDEQNLAKETPYKLTHLDFKPTPKSHNLLYWVVEMLDDQIQKFTGGKVPPDHVNKFIAEFLDALRLLGLKLRADAAPDADPVSTVRVIRNRNRNRKRMADRSNISSTQQ
jgi:hypothetical protein